MKKIFGKALFLIGIISLFSQGHSQEYKGKLTCALLKPLLMESSVDERVRAICDNSIKACFAHEALEVLPKENPLRQEATSFIESYIVSQLYLCEVACAAFAPEAYTHHLSR